MKEERAELARTLPDIRTTLPGTPAALQAASPASPETPTQPKGKPVSRPPSQPPRSAPTLPQASLTPGPARESQPMHEASIVVDPELLGAPSPSLHDLPARVTRPGARQRSQAKLAAAEPAAKPAAPGGEATPERKDPGSEPSQVRRSAAPLSRYEPLPSDPAAFERLMRERAGARGAPGSRLNWNQQETLLIPRESLRAAPRGPFANRSVLWGVAAAVVVVAIAATVLLVRSVPSADKAMRAVPLSTSTAALTQAESTVITTEPAGAELLQTGAVLGNTPLEVRRPKSGEIGYTVRLSGYQPESVVVTPGSKPTIRLVLRPAR